MHTAIHNTFYHTLYTIHYTLYSGYHWRLLPLVQDGLSDCHKLPERNSSNEAHWAKAKKQQIIAATEQQYVYHCGLSVEQAAFL